MTQFSYTAAHQRDWLAVAASGRLLVVRVDDDAELLTRVASLDIGALSVHETLDVLTARGLAHTPAFGLCFWVAGTLHDDGVGVIVYGETAIDIATTDGTVTVRATGVSGWGEQLIEGATGVDVRGGADTADALPLGHGAAWIAGLSLVSDRAESDAATAAPQRETAAVSAVESEAPPLAREPSSEPKPDTIAIDEPLRPAAPATEHDPTPAEPQTAEAQATEPGTDTAEQPVWSEESAAADADDTAERDASESVGDSSEVPEMTLLPSDLAGPIELPEPDEQTIMRTPGQPAVPAREEPLGDHDGMTVLAEDVRAARDAAHLPEGAASQPQSMPGFAYSLELPGGGRQKLDAPVILGRAPSVSNVPASVLPHLVTLAGDDISRTHVRVAVEGDAVVVTDLHSSNGTVIEAPGRPPQQLRGGEPVPVITGTTIDLGSGITLRVLEV